VSTQVSFVYTYVSVVYTYVTVGFSDRPPFWGLFYRSLLQVSFIGLFCTYLGLFCEYIGLIGVF